MDRMDAIRKISKKYQDSVSTILGKEVEVITIVNTREGGVNKSFIMSEVEDLFHAYDLVSKAASTMQSIVQEQLPSRYDTIN